jgi:hypothetical protein
VGAGEKQVGKTRELRIGCSFILLCRPLQIVFQAITLIFMDANKADLSIYRALTTVNAPVAVHMDAHTLARCLRLEDVDVRWRPHVRAFFEEVGIGIILDMVVEGTVSFDDLARCARYWRVEESGNARWIREMAPFPVAALDGNDLARDRLGVH